MAENEAKLKRQLKELESQLQEKILIANKAHQLAQKVNDQLTERDL